MAAEARNISENPQREQIRAHLKEAWKIYGVDKSFLKTGIGEAMLLHKAINLLITYDMDPKFYEDTENSLVALAFAQELLLANDSTKADRMKLGFTLFTGTGYYVPFSHSRYVRETYLPNFTPKPREAPVPQSSSRRQIGEDPLAGIYGADYRAINKQMTVNGESVWNLAETVVQRLGGSPSAIDSIKIAQLEEDALGKLGILAFIAGDRIAVDNNTSRHDLMHELVHALAGFHLVRGYQNFFLRGVLEGITERITDKPTYYEDQRKVLSQIGEQVSDSGEFFAYVIDAYKGDEEARREMWKMLIKTYGLRSIVYFGLLDPGAPELMKGLMGEENAKVFIPAGEVLDFFSSPDVINN